MFAMHDISQLLFNSGWKIKIGQNLLESEYLRLVTVQEDFFESPYIHDLTLMSEEIDEQILTKLTICVHHVLNEIEAHVDLY